MQPLSTQECTKALTPNPPELSVPRPPLCLGARRWVVSVGDCRQLAEVYSWKALPAPAASPGESRASEEGRGEMISRA